ncbi:MAG TPA: DUF1990 domain-containing protein [Rubrobacter sp.]|nr:DUF1990 domain-containing protein [Rubrobacter sp.]
MSRFLDAQRDAPFSYDEVGATREAAKEPAGYAVDHNRAKLGEGRDTLGRAVAALHAWKMFDIGWARVIPEDAPVEVGTTVAVLARHYGFLSLNPCRIVYTFENDDGDCVRRGFAYGTLPEHGERGEERFSVEWRRDDDSVFYEIYAFSRPNHLLANLGYPLARSLQHRFAKDSLQAMVRATSSR